MKIFTQEANMEKTFAGEMILASGGSKTLDAIRLDALGTQKVYGKNGVQIVGRIGDKYYIIPKAWNTAFARAVDKVLPSKRMHPSPQTAPISIIWAEPSKWCQALDKWAGIN